MIAYFNGEFLPKREVAISPDDRGWLFADGVYEVIRAYHGRAFRLEQHLARLRRNLGEIALHLPAELDLSALARELLARNGLDGDAAIYVQVSRGAAARAHAFPPPGTPPTVYLSARPFRTDPGQLRDGVLVHFVPDTRWARCDIKTVNLLPNVLAQQAARDAGAQEAVFARGDRITEGTHTSMAAVIDGTVVTSPETENILPSVTRAVLFDLSRELGIPVREDVLTVSAFARADEGLLLGTTTELTPVSGVIEPAVRFDAPGPVTRELQRAFYRLVDRECAGTR